MGDTPAAGSQLRVLKPKTRRGARALLKRAPRLVEELKKVLLLHGGKTSAVLKDVLSDLGALKRGECLKLSRKNEAVRPFESGGEGGLEFLCLKADCSLFCLANHSKKRPHNLVLGRMFDFKVLDMLELGVRTSRLVCLCVPEGDAGGCCLQPLLTPCTPARCSGGELQASAPVRAGGCSRRLRLQAMPCVPGRAV
jgi:hypothetical protein